MRIRGTQAARWRHVPAGMRDIAADEMARHRWLESRWRDLFARWGYVEVQTPLLEFLETFLQGAGPGIGDRLLKLVDTGGEVLALRPEMTVPLARYAATRLLPAGTHPRRLAYVAVVFRGQERGSGRERQFTQAGVELIGDGGLAADAEVVALAAEALRAAGVDQATVSIGHAGFLRGVLATLPAEAADAARDLLYRRAFAELERVVPPGAAREALRAVPGLRGPDALRRAAPLAVTAESREALETLEALLAALAAYDPGLHLEIDLGLIRDFDYYTGVVFEAHGPRAGRPLLGGGRYDGVLARFGQPAPATGFALGVERVLEAARVAPPARPTVVVRYDGGGYARAVRTAARLRTAGAAVVLAAGGAPASLEGQAFQVWIAGEGVEIESARGPAPATLEALCAQLQAMVTESCTSR
ncbi:MAG: ATP phosphoribosyltransferase regulatory subunit [Armatimonadota bacterium]|nr:ATP phosphoribosyltransferase regulatory subunit [Armatimonadota bacterium]